MSGGGALSQQVNTQPSYSPAGGKGGAAPAGGAPFQNMLGNTSANLGNAAAQTQALAAAPAQAAAAQQPAPQEAAQSSGPTYAAPNMYQQSAGAINQAMANARAGMGYSPMSVGSYVPEAQQLTEADISRFYNPYESQVVDTSLADIERARMMQQNAAAAQATAAGAFGGSRGALMEAEVGRNALDQAARTASQLRQQGYTTALGAAQTEAQRMQQAAQFGAGQQMQADVANQAARLAAAQQRMSAGQQLAALGNLGFGQAQDIQSQMMQQGALQQMLQQQIIDAAKQQYAGYAAYPQQSLGYYTQALGASQIPQSQTTSSQPGLFGWASMLLGSDIRFKENIRPAGKTAGGHNLYMWDWNDTAKEVLGEEGSSMGVIAQEVIETNPELVVTGDHGYYMVNYGGIQ